MKLQNRTQNQILVNNLSVAKNIFTRIKGLLGKDGIGTDDGLWIKPCNSIHTWFMKFPIDAVFVDKNLVVQGIHQNVNPWNLIVPKLSYHSVFELQGGRVNNLKIQLGDQLDVVD